MTRLPEYAVALAAGMFLGAAYFGGLRWTVARGLASARPALWFGASLLLRLALLGAGLLAIFRIDLRFGLAAAAGIMVVRVLVLRIPAAAAATAGVKR